MTNERTAITTNSMDGGGDSHVRYTQRDTLSANLQLFVLEFACHKTPVVLQI